MTPRDVVAFWQEAGPEKWFNKDDAFDEEVARLLGDLHFAAAKGDLKNWQDTAQGTLALLILLDQAPRNIFRNSAHSHATDGLARRIAQDALSAGFDRATEQSLRLFFYLPFEHSEDLADQDTSLRLFQSLFEETGQQETLDFAVLHRDLIKRFGRFPHRNRALGRITTPEEQAYLDEDGFKG
ncbi:DUF924 family protein [Allorhizobium terrae]|uniref:DUF924 domain-containing protein n=1 Tax=Allorhizobium terrae TaxID=1848972 RepID=A0A4S3ZVZ7_9HYPH|nr:DUF924 family protein [Allorhizobium terrae]THF50007.1 DUF924 domain-containing protein [Allorhizobium terrae]